MMDEHEHESTAPEFERSVETESGERYEIVDVSDAGIEVELPVERPVVRVFDGVRDTERR